MHILGLNAFHADAAACLVSEGKLVAAVAEERLGDRRKHFAGFPGQAIRRVLEMGGISLADVTHVAVGHNSRVHRARKAAYALSTPLRSVRSAATALSRQRQLSSLESLIACACGVDPAACRFDTVNVEHHVAHLASSFYGSDFEEAAGFSYDASGDFVSTAFAHCSSAGIDVRQRVFLPHSLGYFYTAICQFIGFDHFGEEYKVMGLAAYGTPRYRQLMQKLLIMEEGGRFRLDGRFFAGLLQRSHEELLDAQGQIVIPPLYSPALAEELGPARMRGAVLTQRDHDLAASCQAHFEDVVLHCLRWLHQEVPVDTLVAAGGCALNGVCNSRIRRETPFKRGYIHGAAGDDGTAVGAALHVWHAGQARTRAPTITHASLGPEYSEDEMAQALAASALTAEKFERDALLARIAGLLAKGRVVGWYQGRGEWGPRALGNRSILAHPGWPGMKDIINLKIKRREAFRPFAPSVLRERVGDYFEQDLESPFMMHVVKIREERRAELAAVTHEDGTGRLHTVARIQNPLYYDLLRAFESLTGTGVLLNTSFNENEPIVDAPAQAVNCYLRNDIDVLCLGPFVVCKPNIGNNGPAD